jgi:hypothetical protein
MQGGPRLYLNDHSYVIEAKGKDDRGNKLTVATADKFNTAWKCSRAKTSGVKCGGRAATRGSSDGYWAIETTPHADNC